MIGIVIFEVAIVASAYSKKDDLKDIVDKGLRKTLNGVKDHQSFNATWHLLQTEVSELSQSSHQIGFIYKYKFHKNDMIRQQLLA